MFDLLNVKPQKSLLILITMLSLVLLSACTPHSASGTWVASGDNQANYSKILIHFEPKLEIYAQGSVKPVQYCGWSAISKQKIEMGCMSSDDQIKADKYQLNIINKTNAELIQEGKVIANFKLVDEK